MIVVNCRFLTQPMTGVQRFAEEIVEALASIRNDLVLVAPPGTLRRRDIGGLEVHSLGAHTGHLWEQWDLPRAIIRRRANRRPTLLLSLMNTGPALLRHQVLTHHDVTYARYPHTYSWTFRTFYRTLSSVTMRRARRIVTVSEFSRREIADVYGVPPEKIVVVPNAAGPRFTPATHWSPSTHPYFLAVSSDLVHKNLDLLLQSFTDFVDGTDSRTRLRLVGSRPSFAGGAEPGHRGDGPRVQWVGRVDEEELVALYRGARALVFPSLYEGFGIPPLEAQACGCPVISSDAASLPEVLADSAVFFSPHDPHGLTTLLAEIDRDGERRERLRVDGLANQARFSWAESARTLSDAIDHVFREETDFPVVRRRHPAR